MNARMTVYVYVSDLPRMREFYEGAVDIKPALQTGNWLPFDLGGATFALHGNRGDPTLDLQRFHLSFDVDGIDAAVDRFRTQGAKVLRSVADEAFGKRAILRDPDGRQLEIVQHDPP